MDSANDARAAFAANFMGDAAMLSLYSVLTFALLATAPATTASTGFCKDGEIHIRFYDLSKIHGAVKVYVASTSYPGAGCNTCPSGGTAEYCVPPEMVYQTWPQGGKYLEVIFPASCVGGMESFCYTAVSCLATEERFIETGQVTELLAKGKR